MGRNIRLAFSWVASAQDPERVYFDAFDQIWYAREREALALNSLRSIAPELDDIVDRLIRELDRREDQAVRELEVAYRQAHGERPPQQRAPASETEMELAQIRPSLVAGPTEFLTGRRQLRGVDGLHDLMAFEVLSAVDGRVTALEIYRYVAAEAREAGRRRMCWSTCGMPRRLGWSSWDRPGGDPARAPAGSGRLEGYEPEPSTAEPCSPG
jgi:hypothetical protein